MRSMIAAVLAITLGGFGVRALTATAQAAPGDLIGAIDQAHRQVLILDQHATTWDGQAAVKWPWSAPDGSGWNNLSDVKFRTDHNGVKVVLVAASGGNVGSLHYATGRVIWQATIPESKPPCYRTSAQRRYRGRRQQRIDLVLPV